MAYVIENREAHRALEGMLGHAEEDFIAVPTIEMSPFLTKRKFAQTAIDVTSTGWKLFLTVPANERIKFDAIRAIRTGDAAETSDIGVNGPAAWGNHMPLTEVTAAANQTHLRGIDMIDVWLPPRTKVYCYVSTQDADDVMTMNYWYQSIEV
jgi:hypothetical protein